MCGKPQYLQMAFSAKEVYGVDAFEDWINKSVLNVFDELTMTIWSPPGSERFKAAMDVIRQEFPLDDRQESIFDVLSSRVRFADKERERPSGEELCQREPRNLSSLLELINSGRGEPLSLEQWQTPGAEDENINPLIQELNQTIDAENIAQEKAASAQIMAEACRAHHGAHRQITDYKVVSGKTIAAVQQDVRKFISLGWQPMGGICCFWHVPSRGQPILSSSVRYQ